MIFRVGQEFWAYDIQGSYKLGVQYLYAEIWVFGISFVSLQLKYATSLSILGTDLGEIFEYFFGAGVYCTHWPSLNVTLIYF